jgi:hypothetical protein
MSAGRDPPPFWERDDLYLTEEPVSMAAAGNSAFSASLRQAAENEPGLSWMSNRAKCLEKRKRSMLKDTAYHEKQLQRDRDNQARHKAAEQQVAQELSVRTLEAETAQHNPPQAMPSERERLEEFARRQIAGLSASQLRLIHAVDAHLSQQTAHDRFLGAMEVSMAAASSSASSVQNVRGRKFLINVSDDEIELFDPNQPELLEDQFEILDGDATEDEVDMPVRGPAALPSASASASASAYASASASAYANAWNDTNAIAHLDRVAALDKDRAARAEANKNANKRKRETDLTTRVKDNEGLDERRRQKRKEKYILDMQDPEFRRKKTEQSMASYKRRIQNPEVAEQIRARNSNYQRAYKQRQKAAAAADNNQNDEVD